MRIRLLLLLIFLMPSVTFADHRTNESPCDAWLAATDLGDLHWWIDLAFADPLREIEEFLNVAARTETPEVFPDWFRVGGQSAFGPIDRDPTFVGVHHALTTIHLALWTLREAPHGRIFRRDAAFAIALLMTVERTLLRLRVVLGRRGGFEAAYAREPVAEIELLLRHACREVALGTSN